MANSCRENQCGLKGNTGKVTNEATQVLFTVICIRNIGKTGLLGNVRLREIFLPSNLISRNEVVIITSKMLICQPHPEAKVFNNFGHIP